MRKLMLHAGLVAALLLIFGAGSYAVAHGGKRNVKSEDMTGYLEAPSVSTVASGDFRARINDSTDTVEFRLEYEGLEADATQAHIHFGQRSVSGGISVWLCSNLPSPPTPAGLQACPLRGGTVTGTFTASDVVGPSGQGIAAGEFEELVAAIRAGVTYANVHSTKFPPGEIRGQLNDRRRGD
jgi:CHRD domain